MCILVRRLIIVSCIREGGPNALAGTNYFIFPVQTLYDVSPSDSKPSDDP